MSEKETKKLYNGITGIDDDIIEGAQNSKPHKKAKSPVWVKWGAMAACLCLIVSGGVFLYSQNIRDNNAGNDKIAMIFTEAKVIEVYSSQSVLVEVVEENIYHADTEKNLFLVGDRVQADFNEAIVSRFAAGDIVVIGRGNTANVDYSNKPYIAQCNSIQLKSEKTAAEN